MAKSGPPPKPTALKVLEGNPGKRPLNTDEPKPKPKLFKPPAHLSGEALAEWGRVVPALHELGLVTEVDRAALIAYCEAWGTYCDAQEIVRAEGITVRGDRGQTVKHPALAVVKDCLDAMLKYGSRFGMTPSDRTRLQVPTVNKPPEESPEAEALRLLS